MVDKLTEECTEDTDEARLAGIALFEHENACVCSYTICVVLGPVLILHINTSIVIKKIFLSMIISIKQKIINHIKWEK